MEKCVTPVLLTLSLLGTAAGVVLDGLETTVMHALEGGPELTVIPVLPTLDPLDNVTPALIDGLGQIVNTVKDSDSAPSVTVRDVSRTVSGQEQFMERI